MTNARLSDRAAGLPAAGGARLGGALCVVTLALGGCSAVDVVTDQMVKAQLAYCDLSNTSRAAVARQYLERLPQGYDIDVDCPGDRPD